MNTPFWDRQALNRAIRELQSCLCIGLDTDETRIPRAVTGKNKVFEFNKSIIDATADLAVAYKINAAFYEAMGPAGWQAMAETIACIRDKKRFVILDAKRGDIGNTGELYARACFEQLNADAVTVSPYMGRDSVLPFLSRPGRWAILLALTSNTGAEDFQLQRMASGRRLFEEVIHLSSRWGSSDQLMYVAGATRIRHLQEVRNLLPGYFLLIPGVGAQGGDLGQVMAQAMTTSGDLLINASRSILYASAGPDFVQAAREEALKMQSSMRTHILEKSLNLEP
jgi:orotidine-5'-phosphate decarboxylase